MFVYIVFEKNSLTVNVIKLYLCLNVSNNFAIWCYSISFITKQIMVLLGIDAKQV